ncbi:MAG: outer membrane beta-barrel protein [Rhizomicrobium sp.]
MGVRPQWGMFETSAPGNGNGSRADTLGRIAECLSLLAQRLAGEADLDGRALSDKFEGALIELRLLRATLAQRIAANDSRAGGLQRIDAALEELSAVFVMLEAGAQQPRYATATAQHMYRYNLVQKALRRAAMVIGFSAAGASITGFAVPAIADDATSPTYIGMTPQDVGVLERPRPEYDAKGVPLGGFRLFPSLDVSANYDDNVLRIPAASSDWYFEEAPSLRLISQWGRHFFEVYGGADNYNYASFSRLNLTDWNVGSDGRFDISRAADWSANASYGEYHEALSSPNTVGFQSSPNRYNKTHVDTTGRYQPNRLGFSIGGGYDRYDWLNTPKIGGGLLFNTDRNEDEFQGFAKVNYDFSPGYSGYVKALYDSRQFDLFFDRTGVHRASNGYRFDAGLTLQLTHLLAGDVYVGYLNQDFAAPLKNISGVDYGVSLDWFALPVLTVHLNGEHQINDVTIGGVSASDDKLIKLSADYEFRRNIIVQGYFSYTDSELVGTTRTDNYPGAGIGVKYLMTRYMSANVRYNYSERSSNFPGIDYTDNTISLGLSLHI